MAWVSQGDPKHGASIIDYAEHHGILSTVRTGPIGKCAWLLKVSPSPGWLCVPTAGLPAGPIHCKKAFSRGHSVTAVSKPRSSILPHAFRLPDVCLQAANRLSSSCKDKRWGAPRYSLITLEEEGGVAFTVVLGCHQISSHQTASKTSNVI